MRDRGPRQTYRADPRVPRRRPDPRRRRRLRPGLQRHPDRRARALRDAPLHAQQEQIIGRDQRRGVPLHGRRLFETPDLTKLPEHAHIRQASPRTSGVTILRRGYDTEDGLLFLAFMQDPRRQFVPLQRRVSERDALHPHTTTKASAVFAIPPELSSSLLYAQ